MVRTSGPKPVKTQIKDVTGARALDTEYQNITGRPLLVLVTAICTRRANDEHAIIISHVKATPPVGTSPQGSAGLTIDAAITETVEAVRAFLTFAVTPGWYYKVEASKAGASTVILNRWVEVEL